VKRTQRVTMGLVGMLVASLLLVLVAEAQVLVEGYFCKDGRYVQPFIAPSLESTLYKNDNYPSTVNPSPGKEPPGNPNTYLYTYCNQPFPYPFGSICVSGSSWEVAVSIFNRINEFCRGVTISSLEPIKSHPFLVQPLPPPRR
jgi:hypothetical protein